MEKLLALIGDKWNIMIAEHNDVTLLKEIITTLKNHEVFLSLNENHPSLTDIKLPGIYNKIKVKKAYYLGRKIIIESDSSKPIVFSTSGITISKKNSGLVLTCPNSDHVGVHLLIYVPNDPVETGLKGVQEIHA